MGFEGTPAFTGNVEGFRVTCTVGSWRDVSLKEVREKAEK